MKKVMRKLLTCVMTLAIIASLIAIPSFADETGLATGVYFTNDFDLLTAGAKWDAMSFPASQVTAPDGNWGSNMMFASLSGAASPTSGADRDAATVIERGNNGADKALRLGTSQTYETTYNVGAQLYPNALKFTRGEGKVLHVSVDMLAEDKAANKFFYIRRNVGGTKNLCEIVNFNSNGRIYVWGDYWRSSYNLNEWYNFDMYLDFDSKKVYLCSDGKLVKTISDGYFTADEVLMDIIQISTSTNQKTGIGIDNLKVEVMNKADAAAITNAAKTSGYYLEHYSSNYDAKDDPAILIVKENAAAPAMKQSGFGKRDTDKSLFVGSDNHTVSGTGSLINVYMSQITFAQGSKIHYSTMLAIGENSPEKKIVRLHTGNGNVDILTVTANGMQVYTIGKYLPVMEANQWYKFDFVITIGSPNLMDVYANGVKYAENVEIPNAISAGAEITTRYYANAGTADGFWADDVVLASYDAEAEFVSPEVTFANSNLTIKKDRVVNVEADYTVGQFVADTTANVRFDVVDKSGYKIAANAPLAGNLIVFYPPVGGEVYYPVYAKGYTLFQNEFDSEGDSLTVTGATSELKSGVAGKADVANILTADDSGAATLTNTKYMYINTNHVTLEATVLAPDKAGASAVFYLQETPVDKRPVVTFSADGKILCPRAKDSGLTWTPGAWYKVTALINVASGGGRAYLNGQNMGYLDIFLDNTCTHGFGLDITGVGTVSGIDGIHMYDGAYVPTNDLVTVAAIDNTLLIDNDKREIYITEDDAMPWFFYFGDNISVYSDMTFANALTSEDIIEAGNVLAVTSANGDTIQYYTVKDIADAQIYAIKQDGAYVSADSVIGTNLDVTAYGADSDVLFVAQYAGNKLLKADMATTATLNGLVIDADTQIVKIILVDSIESIKPVRGEKSLTVER